MQILFYLNSAWTLSKGLSENNKRIMGSKYIYQDQFGVQPSK